MDFEPGAVFAGYRIERRIGAGGMGTVFLVQHPRLPRMDALKVLADRHSEDEEFRARFLREAEIAARVSHPNVVSVRDRGTADGRLWITMQYVDGIDLRQLIARTPGGMAVPHIAGILADTARGLDEIHRAGLVHRDVKPANILIAEQPGQPSRALIADFGIARPDDISATGGGDWSAATLAYAAPEQLVGGTVDRRADVYALGCTLYQMLTGTVPFARDSAGAVMYAHVNEPPPQPSRTNSAVPQGFDAVIARAMAKDPADRYPSCGDLAAAVNDVARALMPSPERNAVRSNRFWGMTLAAAAAVVVLLTALLAAWTVNGRDPTALPARTGDPDRLRSQIWGEYVFVVEPFAELFPPWTFGVGYQELTKCDPVDGTFTEVSVKTAPVRVARMLCLGNLDPVNNLTIACNTDRSAIAPEPVGIIPQGNERWTRPSGSGTVRWGKVNFEGVDTGQLEVFFDSPTRNFCSLRVIGGNSGEDLRSRWWPDAPL